MNKPRAKAVLIVFLISALTASGAEVWANGREAEQKVVDYLTARARSGEPLVVTKLYNEVFTSPEERRALNKLYNIVFKIPSFLAQYTLAARRPPKLVEISQQFGLTLDGEADLLLRILESDPRVPHFFTRDSLSGEITAVEVERIKSDPRFGKTMERSLTDWEGKAAPDFRLRTLDGGELSLSSFKGRLVLLYFWFTHCPPCAQITPHLVSLQKKHPEQIFKVIGLNADNLLELGYDDAERQAYLKAHSINFPVVHLSSEVQAAYGGVSLFPTLFLVDREGIIRAHFVNYQEEGTLEKVIRAWLK